MGKTSFNLAYMFGGRERHDSFDDKNELKKVGDAGNVVPDIAEFVIDIRPSTPGLDGKAVIEILQERLLARDLEAEIISRTHDLGAWYTDSSDIARFADIVRKVVGRGIDFDDPKTSGYLDLQMLWEATGRPVACMFGGGVGDTAHRSDEHIELDNLIKTRDFFREALSIEL